MYVNDPIGMLSNQNICLYVMTLFDCDVSSRRYFYILQCITSNNRKSGVNVVALVNRF